jgi:hypothetical protein
MTRLRPDEQFWRLVRKSYKIPNDENKSSTCIKYYFWITKKPLKIVQNQAYLITRARILGN